MTNLQGEQYSDPQPHYFVPGGSLWRWDANISHDMLSNFYTSLTRTFLKSISQTKMLIYVLANTHGLKQTNVYTKLY